MTVPVRSSARLRAQSAIPAPAPPATVPSAGPKKEPAAKKAPVAKSNPPKTPGNVEDIPKASKKRKEAPSISVSEAPAPKKKKKTIVTTLAPPPQPTRQSRRVRHPTSKTLTTTTTTSSSSGKGKSVAPVAARLVLLPPPPFPSLSTWTSAWTEPPLAPTISFDRKHYIPLGEDTLGRHKKEVVALRKELAGLNRELDGQLGDGVVTKDRVKEERLPAFGLDREMLEAVEDAEAWGKRPLEVLRVLDYLVAAEDDGEEEEGDLV